MNAESDYSVRPSDRSREVSGLDPVSHTKDERRNRTRAKTRRKRSPKGRGGSKEIENGDQVAQDQQEQSSGKKPPDDDHVVDCLV